MKSTRAVFGLILLAVVVVGFFATVTRVDAAVTPGQGAMSINFVGGGTAMGAAESAGVAARSNWNNAYGASRTWPLPLKDETGTTTTARVTWSAASTYTTPITNNPGNKRLMKGYLNTTNSSSTTVTISGLPANTYDVYVYADGNNGSLSQTGTYRISGAGIVTTSIDLTDAANTDFSGTFVQANNSTGNYVKVTITATGFTLTATPLSPSTSTKRAPVNGLQIIPTAGQPATNQAPTVNAGNDQTITLPTSTVTLTGTASDDGLPAPPATMTYAWSIVSGPAAVTFSAPSALTTAATFTAEGTYTLRLMASDSALSASDEVVVTVNQAQSFSSIRINSGGPSYTDSLGNVWSADKNYSGGATYTTSTTSISGTVEDTLYRSERYGNVSYAISVPSGSYTLKLHFAEVYWNAAGKRVFDVTVEGALAIDNLDIWAAVGANAALIRTLQATVTDGTLNIGFVSVVDNAKVSAIEVLPLGDFGITGTVSPPADGAGTALALGGAAIGSTIADGSGNYSFSGLGNGSYLVVPSKSGYTFVPSSRVVTVNGASVASVDFTAAVAPPTYSVSGTISPVTGGAGATVTLSGDASATTTANSSGNYSFSGLANGTYVVTPSSASATFTPTSQTVVVNGANRTGINFTATTTVNVVFFDDFTDATINPAWTVFNRAGDASNSEKQCYRTANAAVSGGNLTLTAKVETVSCGDATHAPSQFNYTSGGLFWSSFNYTYGTIEVRAKLTGGQGPWPAIWFLGANCQPYAAGGSDGGGACQWPQPGSDEIDIAEILNSNLTSVNQQVHSTSSNAGCTATTTNVSQNYHVYQLVWSPTSLVWKIDGTQTCRLTSNISSTPMFLILNVAMGGIGGGSISNSTLPQSMSIDYVKVTQ